MERWKPILDEAIVSDSLPPATDLEHMVSWIIDIEILLAMHVITLGSPPSELARDVDSSVMNGVLNVRPLIR